MYRRYLHMDPEEVTALPWWKADLYDEGLLAEFTPAGPAATPDDGIPVRDADPEPVPRRVERFGEG